MFTQHITLYRWRVSSARCHTEPIPACVVSRVFTKHTLVCHIVCVVLSTLPITRNSEIGVIYTYLLIEHSLCVFTINILHITITDALHFRRAEQGDDRLNVDTGEGICCVEQFCVHCWRASMPHSILLIIIFLHMYFTYTTLHTLHRPWHRPHSRTTIYH